MAEKELEIYEAINTAVDSTHRAYIVAGCTEDGPTLSNILDQLHKVADKHNKKIRESFNEDH